MDAKTKQLEKERAKALGDVLVAECKAADYSFESIEAILNCGADINYNNSKPLYFATKQQKFDLVKFLINHGALNAPIARTYISSMCDFKGFSDEIEPQFFEILDIAHSKTGDYMTLFTPYINSMAVAGRLDKIRALMKRYYLTESEIVSVIYIRIIFEIINNGYAEMLAFISKHKDFIDQAAFDLSVSTGETAVLKYFLKEKPNLIPSDSSVATAIYEGYFDILAELENAGVDFKGKSLYLEKASRAAATKGTKSLEFLLRHGYSLTDKYKGKSIMEHAVEDNNIPLQEWLLNKISSF